jgi:hypothetical protein
MLIDHAQDRLDYRRDEIEQRADEIAQEPLVVYISGPIGAPQDRRANKLIAMEVAHQVLDLGHAPVVPHLFLALDAQQSRSYEEWMRVDLLLVSHCDVVLRIPGKSPGADREVAEAQRLGIPVVHSVADLTRAKRATEAA